jgi:hypothetical protein
VAGGKWQVASVESKVASGKWQVASDEGRGASIVRLVVYDLLGREVAVLVNERKQPGNYEVSFDASALASGIYLYRLTAGSFVQSQPMILLK